MAAARPLVPIPGPGGVGDAREGVLRIGKTGTRPERVDAGVRQTRALAALSADRARLLAVRSRRAQPMRDEKMIVAVNGLAIEAFARSREWRHDDRYLDLAKRSAERIWRLAYDAERGELKHEIFRGRAQTDGYLDDYALLANSFMSLYEATRDELWRRRAATLAVRLLSRFAHGDGLATTTATGELLLPPDDSGDGAYPAGTSAAVDVLLRLSAATGDRQYAQAATRIAGQISGAVAGHPEAWPAIVVALDAHGPAAGGLREAARARGNRDEPRHALDSAAHVHATAAVHRLGDRDELRVAIRIDEGYHLNANPASFDYLVPTTLIVDGIAPQRIRYPPATRFKPAFAGEALDVYSGSVTVVAELEKGLAGGAKGIRAALRVQACNEETCLPPALVPLLVDAK